MKDDDSLSPEMRAQLEKSSLTRGIARVHDAGPEQFWQARKRPIGIAGAGLAIATSVMIARGVPVPGLRWVLALVALPFSLGAWVAIIGAGVMVLKGLRPPS